MYVQLNVCNSKKKKTPAEHSNSIISLLNMPNNDSDNEAQHKIAKKKTQTGSREPKHRLQVPIYLFDPGL